MSDVPPPIFLATAVEAVLRAGDVQMEHFGKEIRVDKKGTIDLVTEIDERFQTLQDTLATYGNLDSGFTYYNDLTTDQVKELADEVNALSEPLSQLTATLVG